MRITGGNEQHPDDADSFLRIVATVAKTVGSSREQLETAEIFVDFPWCHVSAYPRNHDHQQAADHEAEEGSDENESDDFQDAGADQAAKTRLGHRSTDQTADQCVRRGRRNSVIPGDDVPDDRPDQRAENDVVIDNGWINGALANSGRHLQLEQEIGKKIEGSSPNHGLLGFENPRRNDGGDRVGCVVKAVHEIEQQGDKNQGADHPDTDLHGIHAALPAQEFSRTMASTVPATSLQRSVTDSRIS